MAGLLPDATFNKEDFESSGWQSIITGADGKTCFWFARALLEAAHKAGEEGKAQTQAALILLGYLSELLFAHESGNAVFVTPPVNVPKDNSALDELTKDHLRVLSLLVVETSDPEMRARIADVLWLRTSPRNPEYARVAVAAYLDSVTRLEDHWPDLADRLRRAAQIGHELGDVELVGRVAARAEDIAGRHRDDKMTHLLGACMELMLDLGHEAPCAQAGICEEAAEKAMCRANQDGAEALWTLAAQWYAQAKQPDAARQARIKAAESHVRMANLHTKGSTPAHSFAVPHIEQAIAALSKIPNTRERVLELRQQLANHQEASLAEMKGFSVPMDFTKAAEEARQAVRGKSFPEALATLAVRMGGVKDYATVERETRQQNEARQLETLFTKTLLDHRGRTVAKSNRAKRKAVGLAETDPALWNRMVQDTTGFDHAGFAIGMIEPARRQIVSEHSFGIRDWWPIVVNSPFVPAGREGLWALGLHAGLCGNLPESLHLLVPQLEHAVRIILRQRGVPTTSLDDGIEEEKDLTWLLDHETTRDVLGDTHVFHLKCLLVERFGSNLRNRAAHGLLDDGEVRSYQVLYLWWFALRLCLIPLLRQADRARPGTAGTAGSGTAKDLSDTR